MARPKEAHFRFSRITRISSGRGFGIAQQILVQIGKTSAIVIQHRLLIARWPDQRLGAFFDNGDRHLHVVFRMCVPGVVLTHTLQAAGGPRLPLLPIQQDLFQASRYLRFPAD